MKLMDHLNDSKINCPKPLRNNEGNYLIKLKNKSACIVSFLKGKDKKTLNSKNCYDIGKMIAKMHSFTKKIKLYRSRIGRAEITFDNNDAVLHLYPNRSATSQ